MEISFRRDGLPILHTQFQLTEADLDKLPSEDQDSIVAAVTFHLQHATDNTLAHLRLVVDAMRIIHPNLGERVGVGE